MLDQLLAPIVGGLLFCGGVVMIRSHLASWRKQQARDDLDRTEQSHLRNRFRRRMQASGLLALLGILIAVGDALIPWEKAPGLFAIYWMVVLILPLWIVFLGLGDLSATRTHSKTALSRIQAQQRELERQLLEERSKRSNGHHDRNR